MISLFLIEYNHQYISDLIFWSIQALTQLQAPDLLILTEQFIPEDQT